MALITEREKQEIKELVFSHCSLSNIEDLEDSTNLFDDLDFDDLTFLELLVDLEYHFDIEEISIFESRDIKTVENIYSVIEKYL